MTDGGVRSPALRGAAFGVTILGFFAPGWLGWGTGNQVHGAARAIVTTAALLFSAVLVLQAWLRWRGTSVPAAPQPARHPSGTRFALIIAAEWVGIGLAVGILGSTGNTEPIPAVVCIGVGLHFFPLAQLFNFRMYYLTTIALCCVGWLTFVLGPGDRKLWTMVPGVGAAGVLWATCIALLFWDPLKL